MGGIVKGMNAMSVAVGGMGDHVHVLMGLNATHTLADMMRELKSESSRWIKSGLKLQGFSWQEGYGAFTFGALDLEQVRQCVLNQSEHHRTKSFQEDYEAMLERGLVNYDERYVW
ncbi:MAG: putative transposase [Verrucomicrobiales bacterium]|jgi:putative transposase